MKRNVVRFLAIALPVIIPLLTITAIDPDNPNMGTYAVICTIIGIAALIGVEIYYTKKKYQNREHVMYIGKDSVKLYQRSEVSAKEIYIHPVHKVFTKYNPSQLVYTGATVGGIHTGGFHTTEAYWSEKSEGASGKYMAFIKDVDGKEYTVDKIVLANDDLLNAAKAHPVVGKFVKEDYIYLKKENSETKFTKEEYDILREAVNTNNYGLQRNITQRAFLESLLTKAEYDAILNWIRGKDA